MMYGGYTLIGLNVIKRNYMKVQKIYVGGHLTLNSGRKIVAVYPAQKGNPVNYLLSDQGVFSVLNGARIQGVGVPRFLESQGFSLAQPGDENAQALARYLDCKEGLKSFEAASATYAERIQSQLGGQRVQIIPFDSDEPIREATVRTERYFNRTVLDLSAGVSAGGVSLEPEGTLRDTFTPLTGWLTPSSEEVPNFPRLTEYGGILEHACYALCSAELASLVGAPHLELAENADADEPFPRGYLTLQPKGSEGLEDRMVVGVNALDETVVSYRRQGQEIYRVERLPGVRLGDVIGFIWSARIHVQERDAALSKVKVRRQA